MSTGAAAIFETAGFEPSGILNACAGLGFGRLSHIFTSSEATNLNAAIEILDSDEGFFLFGSEVSEDVFLELVEVTFFGKVDVFSAFTSFLFHEGEVTGFCVDVNARVFSLLDDGDFTVIGGTEGFFVLLFGENVLGDNHSFGGSVLTGLGGGHGSDFAWESFGSSSDIGGLHHAE